MPQALQRIARLEQRPTPEMLDAVQAELDAVLLSPAAAATAPPPPLLVYTLAQGDGGEALEGGEREGKRARSPCRCLRLGLTIACSCLPCMRPRHTLATLGTLGCSRQPPLRRQCTSSRP